MECLFCKIIKNEIPSYKIYEDDSSLAFLDINPANPGHTLVIPKRHCANFSDLTDQEAQHLAFVSKKVLNGILKSKILSQGANVFMNQGAVAGQEVFHFHWHVLPRLKEDRLGYAFDRITCEFNPEKLSTIAAKIKTYIN